MFGIYERQYTLKEYIDEKIRMLREDFKIYLKKVDIAHIKGLDNEIAVDNATKAIISRNLNKQDLYRKGGEND